MENAYLTENVKNACCIYKVHVYSMYKYNILTEEEPIMAVSRLDEEDDKLIADKPAVPCHREAYACLSTCIWWLEARTDSDLVATQLSRSPVTVQLGEHTGNNSEIAVHNYM